MTRQKKKKKILQSTEGKQNVSFFFLVESTWYMGDLSSSFETTACVLKLFLLAWLVLYRVALASSVSLKPCFYLLRFNRLFCNMSESKFSSRSKEGRKSHWGHYRNWHTCSSSPCGVSSNTFCFNREIDDLTQIHIKVCLYFSTSKVIFKIWNFFNNLYSQIPSFLFWGSGSLKQSS